MELYMEQYKAAFKEIIILLKLLLSMFRRVKIKIVNIEIKMLLISSS